ncbi:MAG: PPC domain-containing DNA-binding protein [Candidatus Moraniibacteriota bacterium]
MRCITLRLKPGQFFREGIEQLAKEQHIQAGVVLSAVGGVKNAVLRMPKQDSGEHTVRNLEGPFEIVSCTGTLSVDGCHIHVSVSDREGKCVGGHLKEGSAVFFTIELVVGVLEDTVYRRLLDPETGFDELVAEDRP